ncbi:hypothetical protein [Mycoplasma sp. P36-A1]|uniref:hypothetical protein n=1 Tax=Mycoplasma sp. P36-A1 TaxID=3252900 RepID=UPI003C2CE918
MGIKTNSHNEIADALTKKLNEIKVEQLITEFITSNPDVTKEEIEAYKNELNKQYGIV